MPYPCWPGFSSSPLPSSPNPTHMYTHRLHFPVFEPLPVLFLPTHHPSFPCSHHLILAVASGGPPGCAEDKATAWAPLILMKTLEGHQEAVIPSTLSSRRKAVSNSIWRRNQLRWGPAEHRMPPPECCVQCRSKVLRAPHAPAPGGQGDVTVPVHRWASSSVICPWSPS